MVKKMMMVAVLLIQYGMAVEIGKVLLKKKQKEFPDTVYVKDRQKVLVKQWQLADDASDVLVFDKNGKLRYKKFGKLDKSEIAKVLELIERHL